MSQWILQVLHRLQYLWSFLWNETLSKFEDLLQLVRSDVGGACANWAKTEYIVVMCHSVVGQERDLMYCFFSVCSVQRQYLRERGQVSPSRLYCSLENCRLDMFAIF